MPTGVYLRTEKHSFNKGRKHPNRKRPISKGITLIYRICPQCGIDFTTDCFQPKKKFCSQSCNTSSRPEMNLANLQNIDKEKQRQSVKLRIGEKHPLWIKDRTLVKLDSERGGPLHKQWSKNVKMRDGWKCKIGNNYCMGRMESHHIFSWKEYPELRYEVSNGITLCHYHHPRKKEDEIRFIPYFQKLLKIV